MNEEKEIWKIYKITRKATLEISTFGRVKKNGEIYECKPNSRGYLRFIGRIFVHRAVAECFVPNPNNYNEVDHIDGNPLNNHYLNLRWCTHKQNQNNPITRKRLSESHAGEKCYMYGKHVSDETKAKMSEAQKGDKSYMYGKPKSEETKKKLSNLFTGRSWFVGSDGKRHWV